MLCHDVTEPCYENVQDAPGIWKTRLEKVEGSIAYEFLFINPNTVSTVKHIILTAQGKIHISATVRRCLLL